AVRSPPAVELRRVGLLAPVDPTRQTCQRHPGALSKRCIALHKLLTALPGSTVDQHLLLPLQCSEPIRDILLGVNGAQTQIAGGTTGRRVGEARSVAVANISRHVVAAAGSIEHGLRLWHDSADLTTGIMELRGQLPFWVCCHTVGAHAWREGIIAAHRARF